MENALHKTLAEWMAENAITLDAAATQMRTTVATVSRWRSGKAIPRKSAMARVLELTDGQVSAESFYQTPRAPSPARGQAAEATSRAPAATKSPA